MVEWEGVGWSVQEEKGEGDENNNKKEEIEERRKKKSNLTLTKSYKICMSEEKKLILIFFNLPIFC